MPLSGRNGFFLGGRRLLPPHKVIAASWPRPRLEFCNCALEQGKAAVQGLSRGWELERPPPGTASGRTGSTLGCSCPGPGPHPAPLRRSPGPALSVAALLSGFEALFLYSRRKLEQTTLFKALLLIFLCVFMTAKRRCFLG